MIRLNRGFKRFVWRMEREIVRPCLEEIDAPMRSLGVAARVEVLASTARFYANDLGTAGTPGHVPLGDRTTEEELIYLRGRLHHVTEEMFFMYESLLLGGVVQFTIDSAA